MTYFITALTNDKARLIVGETRTSDQYVAELVANEYTARGYYVTRRREG